jgi:hypothetical protein
VVQFEPVKGGRRRLRGRVELVVSGEVARFRSVKELVRFMTEAVRRPPAEETGP